jgi:hypothetical protein
MVTNGNQLMVTCLGAFLAFFTAAAGAADGATAVAVDAASELVLSTAAGGVAGVCPTEARAARACASASGVGVVTFGSAVWSIAGLGVDLGMAVAEKGRGASCPTISSNGSESTTWVVQPARANPHAPTRTRQIARTKGNFVSSKPICALEVLLRIPSQSQPTHSRHERR